MTTRRQRAEIEDIAALLDGSLRGEERARVLEALAHDAESYALFEESAMALEEERAGEDCDVEASALEDSTEEDFAAEDESPSSTPAAPSVVPITRPSTKPEVEPGSSDNRRFLLLAATFLVAALGLALWFQLRPPGVVHSAELVAALNIPRDANLRPGTPRGDESVRIFDTGRSAFIAAAQIQRSDSVALIKELRFLAAGLTSGNSELPMVSRIRGAATKLEEGQLTPEQVAAQLVEWESELSDRADFQLGQWFQAASVAVAQEDTAFFSEPAVKSLWRQARGAMVSRPDAVEAIDAVMKADRVSVDQIQQLEGPLKRIYYAYHPD